MSSNDARLTCSLALAAGLLLGCPGPQQPGDDPDAGVHADAGVTTSTDAGHLPAHDAGHADAGIDGGTTSRPDDAGTTTPDAGEPAQCFAGTDEGDLPERVLFRTKRMSFNKQWYVALHDGKIHVKPNTEQGRPNEPWRLLGTGLPAGGSLTHFPVPTEITELSADGTWLHALSSAGVFYRGTDFTQDLGVFWSWSDSWGHPAATGPGMVAEFPTTHGWSVSDSQPPGVHHYEDPLGTVHSVGNGVAHLYRLGADGHTLHFNDWWLPNDWSRQICLPERGTFFAENLSTSGSTNFIIGAQGAMYTRLYDFDTAGENDTLEYSFAITSATGNVRALPAEDWRRQPDITDGLITSKITIFQTGQGNASRMLRVEGVRQGRGGFYFKRINDPAWSFEETGRRVCGPFLNAPGRPAAAPIAPADRALHGTLSGMRSGATVSVELRLANFNITCSPTTAQLAVGGNVVTVGGVPLTLTFHHVHSLTLTTRPTNYWQMGADAVLRAALMLPSTLGQIDDPVARQKVQALFGARKVVNFKGTANLQRVNLVEMTWLDPLVGVVPGNEKTDPGSEVRLEATP